MYRNGAASCPPSVKLILIKRSGRVGPGLAYSTGNAVHILNVPAGRMSAFHDRPDDFLTWLRGQSAAGATPEAFVPRRVFGTYVRSLLNDAVKQSAPGRLELVRGAVTAVDTVSRPLALSGLRSDDAVLLIGTGLTTLDTHA